MRIAVVALAIVTTIGASRSIASAQLSAEDLYRQGQAAYDDGDYLAAAALWERSYGLSREPLLLFNLGQSLRLAGDCEGALAAYRQFAARDPAAKQRPLADELARELELRCGAATSTRPVVGRAPARPGRTLRIAGLATGGAGALTVAFGLGLGHHASSLGDEVTQECSTSCNWSSLKSKDAAGRRYAAIGYALDALGAAAIVGGAAMFYLGDRRRALSLSPRTHDGGAVISWSGSW